jgi:hypothetical protein
MQGLENRLRARYPLHFLRILAAETVLFVGLFSLQFHIVLPQEDGAWPLSILSFVNLIFAGLLSIFAGLIHEGGANGRRLFIATGVLFIATSLLQVTLPDHTVDYGDWAVLISWILSFFLIVTILVRERANAGVQAIFAFGLILQGLVIASDYELDDFLRPDVGVDSVDWLYVSGSALSVTAYILGFQLLATAVAGQSRAFKRLGLSVHRYTHRPGFGRFVSIASSNASFALWRVRRPGSSFADYYAGSIARRLARGGTHRTLGQKRYLGTSERSSVAQGRRGRKAFSLLRELGVHEGSTCVEYGCGSLRVGQHFIRCLERGRFWGLDVIDDFFREGLPGLGSDLIEEKQPNLRVIGENSLAEVKALRPDLIYSVAVIKHVPPPEVDGFLARITSLMDAHTVVAIQHEWGFNARRVGSKTWTYRGDYLAGRIREIRPGARVRFESPGFARKQLLIVDGYEE